MFIIIRMTWVNTKLESAYFNTESVYVADTEESTVTF